LIFRQPETKLKPIPQTTLSIKKKHFQAAFAPYPTTLQNRRASCLTATQKAKQVITFSPSSAKPACAPVDDAQRIG
jgi:hypothetical protein